MVRYGDKPGSTLVFFRFSIGDAAHGFREKLDRIDMSRAVTTAVESAAKRFLKEIVRLY